MNIESMKELSTLLASFVAPFTALTVVFIAYQQWRTNRSRHKYELFNRRFELYATARELILEVSSRRGRLGPQYRLDFRERCLPARFLLRKKTQKYLDVLNQKAIELLMLNEEIADFEGNESQNEHVASLKEKRRDLTHWFDKQLDTINDEFEKDLKLDMKL